MTLKIKPLYNVAMLVPMSLRLFQRRDVSNKTLRNVVTLARTSRRCPIFMNKKFHNLTSVTLKTLMCSQFFTGTPAKSRPKLYQRALPKLIPVIPSNLSSLRHILAPKNPSPPSFGDLYSRLIFLAQFRSRSYLPASVYGLLVFKQVP